MYCYYFCLAAVLLLSLSTVLTFHKKRIQKYYADLQVNYQIQKKNNPGSNHNMAIRYPRMNNSEYSIFHVYFIIMDFGDNTLGFKLDIELLF